MWLLRNGKIIRVDIFTDPCWNSKDIWSARNTYAKYVSMGYTHSDAYSLASAKIWKHKWKGITYSASFEKTLKNSSMLTEPLHT